MYVGGFTCYRFTQISWSITTDRCKTQDAETHSLQNYKDVKAMKLSKCEFYISTLMHNLKVNMQLVLGGTVYKDVKCHVDTYSAIVDIKQAKLLEYIKSN